MMLRFINPGSADILALTTLGVNAKDGPPGSHIGFFGTGFKYAIAGALRLNGRLTLITCGHHYEFGVEEQSIRGRPFQIVTLTCDSERPQLLGFTTELGRHWQPWMIVRELVSNALDENGTWGLASNLPENDTTIDLSGDAFIQVWQERHKYFLPPNAPVLFSTDHCRILQGSGIYMGGIKVLDKPTHFAYDFAPGLLQLNEDRTADSWFAGYHASTLLFAPTATPDFICRWCDPADNSLESRATIDSLLQTPSPALIELLKNQDLQGQLKNKQLRSLYLAHRPKVELPTMSLTPIQVSMLSRALTCLGNLIIPDKYPIRVVDDLGDNVLGEAQTTPSRAILLSSLAFAQGTKILAGTIYEEFLHLHNRLEDCSRPLQNHLINQIMTQVESAMGEPM